MAEENKKEEEKKAEEPEGPNGCIVCLQATWDVIYVSIQSKKIWSILLIVFQKLTKIFEFLREYTAASNLL